MVVQDQAKMGEVDETIYKELDDSLVRATTTTSSLEAEQDSGNIIKTRSKATPNEAGSQGTTSGGGPRRQETVEDTIAQTRFENVSKLYNDSLLARGNTLRSDEDSLKLNELMELCTNLQQRVLDLEKTKTTQQNEIASLKRRVKKLEQKKRSRTHGLKRLHKVGMSRRVESSGDEEDLGEDASKQERRINAIDADDEITLAKQEVADKDVNLTIDEVTLAQALAALKSVKPKVKGDVIEEPNVPVSAASASTKVSAATTTTATIPTQRKRIVITELGTPTITRSSQQPSQEKVQDKDKGKMVEPEPVKPTKKKVQIMLVDDVQETTEVDDDQEAAKIKELMKIVSDEEEVAIDAIPLATKTPSNVVCKNCQWGSTVTTLVDGKKIIITESTVRRDLQLKDAEGVDCLPNATIFEQLALMGSKTTTWNEFSSIMASAIICLATNQKFNFPKYIFEIMVKNLDNVGKFLMYPRNIRRVGKGFSGRETPLFQTMVVQDQAEMGEGSTNPTDPYHTPTFIQPSTSQPQKKQKPKKPKRKDTQIPQSSGPTEHVADEAVYKELDHSLVRAATTASSLEAEQDSGNIIKTRSKATPNKSSSLETTSGGGPRRQETIGDAIAQTRFENVSKISNDLLLARVLDLETTKTTQANEIASLKRRVKRLEKKKRSRTHGLKRLYKVGLSARVEFSGDEESLDNADMFNVNTLTGDEVLAEQEVAAKDGVVIEEPRCTQLVSASASIKQKFRTKAKGYWYRIPETCVAYKEDKFQINANAINEANISWDDIQAKVDADLPGFVKRCKLKEQSSLQLKKIATLFQSTPRAKRKHFAAKSADEKRNTTTTLKNQTIKTMITNLRIWRPVEDLDLVLWKDLKTMFKPHVEDEIWKLHKRGGLLGLKVFLNAILEFNCATLIDVNTAQSKLVLLENSMKIILIDEVTLAQALAALKSVKPKVKANVVEEPSVPVSAASIKVSAATTTTTATIPTPRKGIVITELGTSTTTTTISSQPSQAKVQDKGKGILVEEPVKPKKKDLIRLDEEIASKLQAEFDEEERLAREKDEANVALTEEWDDIQAKVEADYQLAQRLQAQEQEELTDEEKARLFVQFLEQRRKHFAAKRAEEKRNKPPTQAQQRKIMCTYLKNMEGKKPKDLKNKSFDSIQKMFDRAFKRVNTFVDFRTDLVEGSSKRAGDELEQEVTKKQKVDDVQETAKVDDDQETTKIKELMKIVSDEEEVAIDAIPLATKPPSIVDWKIHKEGKKNYYQIIRADGSSKMYLVFSHMLKSFDREDFETLWKLVKAKYGSTRPVEDLDLIL
ncbi:hypothetical protein Tco_0716023 [Tanacetum coccineum]